MTTYYKYDSDGWYCGSIESDSQPENSTTENPNIVDGGCGKKFSNGVWEEYRNHDYYPCTITLSEMRYNLLNDGLYIIKSGESQKKIDSDPQSRDVLRRLAQDFGSNATISPSLFVKDADDSFFEISDGSYFTCANNAVQGTANSLEQTLFRLENSYTTRMNSEEFETAKEMRESFKSSVVSYVQNLYNSGEYAACPVKLIGLITQGE